MIDPTFLAAQRRLFNTQDLLTWVQLEQLAPHWWPDQTVMAEQLGTDRANICLSMKRLQRRDLIRVFSCARKGTWVWWARSTANDRPDLKMAPAWVVRDIHRNRLKRIRLGHEKEWAENKEISYHTLRSMLNGHHQLLRDRWIVVGSPWDCEEL